MGCYAIISQPSLHYPVIFAFHTPQTLFLPTVALAHWWFKTLEDISPGCGFSGEHHYSQKTIEEVVNRRLRKRRKRRTDGKTHKTKTKALLERLLVKAFGKKTINHHDEYDSYRSTCLKPTVERC